MHLQLETHQKIDHIRDKIKLYLKCMFIKLASESVLRFTRHIQKFENNSRIKYNIVKYRKKLLTFVHYFVLNVQMGYRN